MSKWSDWVLRNGINWAAAGWVEPSRNYWLNWGNCCMHLDSLELTWDISFWRSSFAFFSYTCSL